MQFCYFLFSTFEMKKKRALEKVKYWICSQENQWLHWNIDEKLWEFSDIKKAILNINLEFNTWLSIENVVKYKSKFKLPKLTLLRIELTF